MLERSPDEQLAFSRKDCVPKTTKEVYLDLEKNTTGVRPAIVSSKCDSGPVGLEVKRRESEDVVSGRRVRSYRQAGCAIAVR